MRVRTHTALAIGFLLISAGSTLPRAQAAGEDAMVYAKERGWMSVFADGDIRADKPLTRAELLKVVVLASGHGDKARHCEIRRSERLSDVPGEAWYAPYVCVGVRLKILERPKDGLLNPGRKVTLAEAAKMISIAMQGSEPPAEDPWHEPYIRLVAGWNAIPQSVAHHQSFVTRGDLAEILWRLNEQKTELVSASADGLLHGSCTWFEEQTIPGVDLYEVKRAWMGWYNDVRTAMNLQPLTYNKHLTHTAALWSQQAAGKGSITHKRAGQTAYYDYKLMTSWFENHGVEFANIDRTTFTENIGWGVYSCPKGADCTQRFIQSVRSTFDFFISEKGKTYSPHYDSIVNPKYRQLGLGIVTTGSRYYLTAHYGTEITSNPAPVCP